MHPVYRGPYAGSPQAAKRQSVRRYQEKGRYTGARGGVGRVVRVHDHRPWIHPYPPLPLPLSQLVAN